MQLGMLLESLQAPDSGFYVNQLCLELEGDLNMLALSEAWAAAVRRHAVLRTSFVWEDVSEPLQIVDAEAELEWDVQDWRDLDDDVRAAALERCLRDDRRRGFDLSRAPLMRLGLFRTGARRWQLLWTHHHLTLDGWSMQMVLNDVARPYHPSCAARTPPLPHSTPFTHHPHTTPRT